MNRQPRDVCIVDGVPTPVGKYGGALSGVRTDGLAAGVLRSPPTRTPDLDPARIDDVLFGHADGTGEENRSAALCIGVGQGLALVLER